MPGMVMLTWNPNNLSTEELKAGKLDVRGQNGLHVTLSQETKQKPQATKQLNYKQI